MFNWLPGLVSAFNFAMNGIGPLLYSGMSIFMLDVLASFVIEKVKDFADITADAEGDDDEETISGEDDDEDEENDFDEVDPDDFGPGEKEWY